MTEAQARRACLRAAHELLGGEMYMGKLWRRIALATEQYLGPALGLGNFRDRWARMFDAETRQAGLEAHLLVEAMEERAAIVVVEREDERKWQKK